MITMLLGGLWHGAAWTFVIWGGIHGTRAVGRALARASASRGFRLPAWAAWLVTFNVVCLAWVFFRAPDLDTRSTCSGGWAWRPVAARDAAAGVPRRWPRSRSRRCRASWWRDAEAWLVARPGRGPGHRGRALVIVAADAAVGQQGVAPFIYYQF